MVKWIIKELGIKTKSNNWGSIPPPKKNKEVISQFLFVKKTLPYNKVTQSFSIVIEGMFLNNSLKVLNEI